MSDLYLQDFDRTDPNNVGRPNFFDMDMYLNVVEQMITCDEIERAVWMLDNMPGYYRDHMPERARVLKTHLLRKLYVTSDYICAESDIVMDELISLTTDEINHNYMGKLTRAQVTLALCQGLNKKDITPHIHEIAPGGYWLPLGLKKNDVKFTYSAVSLDGTRHDKIKEYLGESWSQSDSKIQIFVCFELIEHLFYPTEIYQHYLKANKPFTHILLSTPKYTVNTAVPNWYDAELGHLRTYTPREFAKFATDHWPEFKWTLYQDEIMVLSGER